MDDSTFQPPALTPRERQCLTLLAKGLRVDAIAEAFGTDPKTVEKQIASARAKLDAATVTQAVALAIRHNLLTGEGG